MDLGELVGMTPEIIQKVSCTLMCWECWWALTFHHLPLVQCQQKSHPFEARVVHSTDSVYLNVTPEKLYGFELT